MLVPPVWAHKQIHLYHSLVVELDRAQSHSGVVVVVSQCSAEKGVKLVDPRLELVWLAEYFVSSYICNNTSTSESVLKKYIKRSFISPRE